ncbi:MAG: DUF4293 domain-containing protein [Bacteroidota bacterium]
MLQRIQSILLLLAILVNLSVLFVPIWQLSQGSAIQVVDGLSIEVEEMVGEGSDTLFYAHEESTTQVSHTAGVVLIGLSCLWLAFTIFQYNDRPRQMRLAYIGIGFLMAEILAYVMLTQNLGAGDSMPHFGFAFPVAALLLVWLAISRIRKDEELVRSVDRIR